MRAKAVFLRDLEELRAQRLALENPPIQAVEDMTAQDSITAEDLQESIMMENNEPTPQPTIKEEKNVPQVPEPEPTEDKKPIETTTEEPKETIPKVSDSSKGLQGPSPPSSLNDTNSKSHPVGLGIDTTATNDDPAPATSELQDSSIDSLFDMPDGGNNDGSDMNFDSMEFLDSGDTQGPNDFDLSTFGNSQDFNMADLHTSNDGGNTNSNAGNKQDDAFDMGNTAGGGDMMDLDLDLGTAGGDDSVFDDMFFDGNTGGGGEMEHGHFDNAYFGLE
jgi:hypothetical protein